MATLSEAPRPYPWPGPWSEAPRVPKRPQVRFPVIITSDGPISSAARLQQLAELESLPETLETIQVDWWSEAEIKQVLIAHVSLAELERMEGKSRVSSGMSDRRCVLFQGKKRFAAVVQALNEGVTLED